VSFSQASPHTTKYPVGWCCKSATLRPQQCDNPSNSLTLGQCSFTIDLCNAANRLTALAASGAEMMKSLIAWKDPAACRDDAQDPLERALAFALIVTSGLLPRGLALEPTLPAADPPTGAATIDGSAIAASTRGVQAQWPGADPEQPSGTKAFVNAPALVVPVIASPEEVSHARELREQLKKKYLNRPSQPYSLWSVGVD